MDATPDLSTLDKRSAYFNRILEEAIANPSTGENTQHRKKETFWPKRVISWFAQLLLIMKQEGWRLRP